MLLLYLAGAFVVYWNVWSAGPSQHVQAGSDVVLNTWFLGWAPHALLHGLNPFFTTAANTPYGINVLDNTSELLLGTLATPVTVLFGPIVTFNLLMTVALAGSAASAYVLARRFTEWRPAAFAGGLLFGFSPYMIAQSFGTHIHLTFMIFPPLILLALHETLVRQRWNPYWCGLALAGLVVAQFFVSVEVFVTTAVTASVAVVAVVIVGRRSISTHAAYVARSLFVAGAAIAVLLAYPVWFLVAGPGHISGPIQLEPEAYRADLLGTVIPDLMQKLTPFGATRYGNQFAKSYTENGSYLGIPLLLALAVGVYWLRRRTQLLVTAVIGIAVFVLSLGGALALLHSPATNQYGKAVGGLPLPEAVLSRLPVLSNLIPGRFAAYVALFAGLLLAMVLDALHDAVSARGPGHGRVVPTLIAVACLFPLVPAAPFTNIVLTGSPPYFSGSAAASLAAGSVTLVLPYPSVPYPQAQLWQVDGSHPFRYDLPGGYFLVAQSDDANRIAYSTSLSYTRTTLSASVFIGLAKGQVPKETALLRAALLAQFNQWRISNVVVPLISTPNAGSTVAFLTWLLGRPTGTRFSGATVWYRI